MRKIKVHIPGLNKTLSLNEDRPASHNVSGKYVIELLSYLKQKQKDIKDLHVYYKNTWRPAEFINGTITKKINIELELLIPDDLDSDINIDYILSGIYTNSVADLSLNTYAEDNCFRTSVREVLSNIDNLNKEPYCSVTVEK